jgi:hypothetical protein
MRLPALRFPTSPPAAGATRAAERAAAAPVPAGPRSAPQVSLLDAVRLPLQTALGAHVRLRVLRLNVADGWAYVEAEPQDEAYGPLDLTGSRHGARLCALARADADGRWRALAYALDGGARRCERWPARFGVPAGLLPLTWAARVRVSAGLRARLVGARAA